MNTKFRVGSRVRASALAKSMCPTWDTDYRLVAENGTPGMVTRVHDDFGTFYYTVQFDNGVGGARWAENELEPISKKRTIVIKVK